MDESVCLVIGRESVLSANIVRLARGVKMKRNLGHMEELRGLFHTVVLNKSEDLWWHIWECQNYDSEKTHEVMKQLIPAIFIRELDELIKLADEVMQK